MQRINRKRLGALELTRNLQHCAIRPACPLPQRTVKRPATCAVAAANDGASSTDGPGPTPGAGPAAASQPNTTVSSGAKELQNGTHAPAPESAAAPATAEEEQPVTFFAHVKRFFTGSKLDKARLAALGFGAFSAYGVISNINAAILITLAWLTVVRTTGLTPLDGANWPRFLAIYAGLWIGSNFLRPVRLTLALAAAPLFDSAISAVSRRTGLPKIPAFVVMLLVIAVGTTSALLATITVFGGFPPGCRMPWQPAVAA